MRLPSQIIFLIFLTTVLFSGVIMAFGHKGFASLVLDLNFFILLTGLVFYIWEIRRKHED